MTQKSLNICLLISGGLGFEILVEIQNSNHKVSAVFTDSNSLSIREYCKENNLNIFVGNPRKINPEPFLLGVKSDIVFSINYLFIVEKNVINHPSLFAFNIHGSLLPKYRGRTPHVWAIINGEKKSGITVHQIDTKVDNGNIVKQITLPINDEDTGNDILVKFRKLYPSLVFDVLNDVIENRIEGWTQDPSKATFYGKRTPDDGLIRWSWSKERIRNWIRAQSKPYPGAFTFYLGSKIIIHKSSLSDYGYHFLDPNGLVLSIDKLGVHVKTPNGALLLEEIEKPDNLIFEKGILLE